FLDLGRTDVVELLRGDQRVHRRGVGRRQRPGGEAGGRRYRRHPGSFLLPGAFRERISGVAAQLLRMAEMSSSSLIFSETRMPPVSSAAFQPRPHSLRLTVVWPSKPIRRLPNGSFAEPPSS